MKNIAVIGCTGSIGSTCLKIIENNPSLYRAAALAAGENADGLQRLIDKFHPDIAYIATGARLSGVRQAGTLDEIASHESVDAVLFASSGFTSATAVIAAMKHGKRILLANKETLVCAGEMITEVAAELGSDIFPVDSEHSAVRQCIEGRSRFLKRVILTASGGAFRDTPASKLSQMTASDALKHPNWSMGRKITVDSATLMNKGLEVIEAKWLFGVPFDAVECVMHRESIVHSLVELTDGSVLAQMSYPSMEIPVNLALSYPDRIPCAVKPLDLIGLGKLSFERLPAEKFPCFGLAVEAGRAGGIMPAVMNAANEVAVDRFLTGEIGFTRIADVIELTLSKFTNMKKPSLSDVFEADAAARNIAAAV